MWRRGCRVTQVSRDTLGTKSPVWAPGANQITGLRRLATNLTHPSFPAVFTEPSAHPGCRRCGAATASIGVGPFNGAGEGEKSGRHRTRVENLHSTTIPAQVARPVELCMKSLRNTTGLVPGAGVDAPCRFPATLSAQRRGLGAGAAQPRLWRPSQSPHPPSFPAPFKKPHENQCRRRHKRPGGPRDHSPPQT
jgi:hypothetical protein